MKKSQNEYTCANIVTQVQGAGVILWKKILTKLEFILVENTLYPIEYKKYIEDMVRNTAFQNLDQNKATHTKV